VSAYDEEARGKLRAMFVQNGVRSDRANEITDLACHAADEAVNALMSVVKRGGDYGIAMMALETATQLAAAHMTGIFERTNALGKAQGAPQYCAEIGLSL
jgi:hypothetical protein